MVITQNCEVSVPPPNRVRIVPGAKKLTPGGDLCKRHTAPDVATLYCLITDSLKPKCDKALKQPPGFPDGQNHTPVWKINWEVKFVLLLFKRAAVSQIRSSVPSVIAAPNN